MTRKKAKRSAQRETQPSTLAKWSKGVGAFFGVVLTGLGAASYLLPPTVDTPSAVFADDPFSLVFEIKNENILPIERMQYWCDIPHANIGGVEMTGSRSTGNGPTLPSNYVSVLWGRDATSGRCEHGYNVPPGIPVRDTEYQLTINYYSLPLLWKRTRQVNFVPITDPSGRVIRWTPK